MRTHYSSLGALDLLFEQEVEDPAALEQQIKTVTEKKEFQKWSRQIAMLLEQSSKRELFKIIDSAPSPVGEKENIGFAGNPGLEENEHGIDEANTGCEE